MPSERPDHAVVADLEIDAAQWPGGWSGDHGAGAGFEVAFVTRAVPAPLLGLVVDDAAEVGAFLAERDDVVVGQPYEDRRVVRAGLDGDKPAALAFDKDGNLFITTFGSPKDGKPAGSLVKIEAGL